MNVLGIDVGFSITQETSSFCLVSIDSRRREVNLTEGPKRFALHQASSVFQRLSSYGNIGWVSIDAPLTLERLNHRPESGRSVDKRFSRGAFHSSHRGPQPGSISVPKQGWPLYEAGMDLLEKLRAGKLGTYVPFESFRGVLSGGAIECIPKLTQALLVPRDVVRERKGNVDEHLFPLLFAREGLERPALNRALGGYKFSPDLEEVIGEISSGPKRYHEELAAIVAAVQGVLLATGRASVVGRVGDSEGYFALPHRDDWHPDWRAVFESTRANGVEVINLDSSASVASAAEGVASAPDNQYTRLMAELEAFVRERDWEQFYSPKNLAMALSVEVAEIVEHFQWLTQEQSRNLPPAKLAEVEQEIGDVMIYLAELANKLGIDPLEAARAKLDVNKRKYPTTLVKGKASKYTEYADAIDIHLAAGDPEARFR
jgi:dCTP diphosphatase